MCLVIWLSQLSSFVQRICRDPSLAIRETTLLDANYHIITSSLSRRLLWCINCLLRQLHSNLEIPTSDSSFRLYLESREDSMGHDSSQCTWHRYRHSGYDHFHLRKSKKTTAVSNRVSTQQRSSRLAYPPEDCWPPSICLQSHTTSKGIHETIIRCSQA